MPISASEHFEDERLTMNINIRQNFGEGVLFKYIIFLIKYLRKFVQRCGKIENERGKTIKIWLQEKNEICIYYLS